MTRPKLLLLDEPAAGMNPQEKVELMDLIRRVRDEFKLTILLIEHDMKLVMGICERIYVLEYGCIIAEGTPFEVRNNPESDCGRIWARNSATQTATASPTASRRPFLQP